MKVSVVIAAKNEARTIQEIVKESRKYSDEVLVIDGHSNDETAWQTKQALLWTGISLRDIQVKPGKPFRKQ